MGYFLENIFHSKKLALIDFKYLSKVTNNTEAISKKRRTDILTIQNRLLCNPYFLEGVYEWRERLEIPPVEAFYIGNGEYNVPLYESWIKDSSIKKPEIAVALLDIKSKAFIDIPSFWGPFLQDFFLKGIYSFPESLEEEIGARDLRLPKQANENRKGGFMIDLGETQILSDKEKKRLSSTFLEHLSEGGKTSRLINFARSSIRINEDSTWSITVDPSITEEADIIAAFKQTLMWGGQNLSSELKDPLQVFSLFLAKYQNPDMEVNRSFKETLIEVFYDKDTRLSSIEEIINRNIKNRRSFTKKWQGWIDSRKNI